MLATRVEDMTIPSFAELTQLCHTLHDIDFLVKTYIATRLPPFNGKDPATAPASGTERLRLLRAFYRRQIICNAWAPTRREASWHERDTCAIANTSEHKGHRLGLYAAFETWELQQVDHTNYFTTQLCVALCLATDKANQPMSEATYSEIFSHTDCLVQYMREQANVTNDALRAPLPPTRIRSRRASGQIISCDEYYRRYDLICLEYAVQTHRLELFPDPERDHRNVQQQQQDEGRASINFVGDALNSIPYGWVDALDGRYVNFFGQALVELVSPPPLPGHEDVYFERHSFLELWRGAGFALWDEARVKAMKELDLLKTLETGWLVY